MEKNKIKSQQSAQISGVDVWSRPFIQKRTLRLDASAKT